MKITFYIISIILILGVLLGYFYWFQWRPSNIRKSCHKISEEAAIKNCNCGKNKLNFNDYNQYYKQCLSAKGLW